jgi:hypothetical protein
MGYKKYENLVPREETPETPEIDPRDAEIERLHAERSELDRKNAANDARLEMMERRLAEGYDSRVNSPTAPSPSATYEAQQELGITEEDLRDNTIESIHKIAERVSAKQNAESMRHVGAVVGNLANSTYEMELKDLSSDPYYGYLESGLRDYFRRNPQEYTNNPGSIRRKYNELVGENIAELQRLAAEKEAADQGGGTNDAPATRGSTQHSSRARVVEPSINVNSPAPDRGGKKTAPVLDEARQDIMDTFNAFGLNMDAEEWTEIEEGRALPKKVSADIQLGMNKPNTDY